MVRVKVEVTPWWLFNEHSSWLAHGWTGTALVGGGLPAGWEPGLTESSSVKT